jgi:hypothetical protein
MQQLISKFDSNSQASFPAPNPTSATSSSSQATIVDDSNIIFAWASNVKDAFREISLCEMNEVHALFFGLGFILYSDKIARSARCSATMAARTSSIDDGWRCASSSSC